MISLSDLKSKRAAMTPRGDAWKVDTGVYGDPDGDADLAFARGPMVRRGKSEPWDGNWQAQAKADAAGIVATHNAADCLIEIAEAAREAVELHPRLFEHLKRLRAALAKIKP